MKAGLILLSCDNDVFGHLFEQILLKSTDIVGYARVDLKLNQYID